MSRFAAGFNLAHAGNAACAAAAAFLASSREADEDSQIFLCDEGEVTAKVVLVVTSFPLMRRGTVYEVSDAILLESCFSSCLRGKLEMHREASKEVAGLYRCIHGVKHAKPLLPHRENGSGAHSAVGTA